MRVGIELIKERKYKLGYVIRTQRYSGAEYGVPDGETFVMNSAYTPEGLYIGDSRMARQLARRGIKPELRTEHSETCSIGFCDRDQKWYGWSHRAICGFAIGDMLFEEDFEGADDFTPYILHGNTIIETLEQARQSAANFAESVS